MEREICLACNHDIGKHFIDVIGKVRCLHIKIYNNRMIGEAGIEMCDCVDYVKPESKK